MVVEDRDLTTSHTLQLKEVFCKLCISIYSTESVTGVRNCSFFVCKIELRDAYFLCNVAAHHGHFVCDNQMFVLDISVCSQFT